MKNWLTTLSDVYGLKLLLILFASQHVLKGFVMSLTISSTDFLLKEHQLTGPQLQMYKAIIALPWALKPLVGILSDSMPLFGYRKAPYILIATILGIFGFSAIGFGDVKSLPLAVGCLFCGNLHVSVCDLLTEAKYSEKLRANSEHGPDLVTFVWGGVTLGSLCAVSMSGWLLTEFGTSRVFQICALFSTAIIFPTFMNFLEEDKMTDTEVTAHRRRMLRNEKEVVLLSTLVAACVVAMAATGLLVKDVTVSFCVSAVVAVLILGSFTTLLRPDIGLVNAFYFIQTSCAVSIDGATFYFFTDDAKKFPGGPNFSVFFYTTVMGLVAAIFNMLGLWSYNKYTKEWRYRTLFLSTNLVLSVLNMISIFIYSRKNLDWGINDKAFVLSGSVLQSLISTWMWMPGVVLMAQLCPRGMEAAMYALLAGCHNIGGSVAQSFGAFLLERLGVNPSGKENEGATFEWLWVAALVSALMPMASLSMIPYCVPNALQTQTVLTDQPTSATAGSPWEQFWARKKKAVDSTDDNVAPEDTTKANTSSDEHVPLVEPNTRR